jgi:hypothetical protein
MVWLTGWSYRKSHVIEPATGAGTLYQKQVTVHYGNGVDGDDDVYCSNHCKTDFGDIRFTDDTGSSELDYWMETKVDSTSAIFWVEIADSLESAAQTIYVYYGKATSTTTSNGANTFSFFDDFEDNDISDWTIYTAGTGTVATSTTQKIGAYSLKIVKPSDWGCPAAASQTIIPGGATTFKFGFKIFQAGTRTVADPFHIAAFQASENAQSPSWKGSHIVQNSADSTIGYFVGAWQNTTGALTQDAWTRILINHTNTTFNLFVDSVDKGSYTNFFGGNVVAVHLGDQGNNIGAETAYFDDLFIAKFVSPEPLHGIWGTEESFPIVQPYISGVIPTGPDWRIRRKKELIGLIRNYLVMKGAS